MKRLSVAFRQIADMAAVYDSNRFGRCFPDIHAATQHIGLTTNNSEPVGRVLFGIDPVRHDFEMTLQVLVTP
jgi:hypothetical protein